MSKSLHPNNSASSKSKTEVPINKKNMCQNVNKVWFIGLVLLTMMHHQTLQRINVTNVTQGSLNCKSIN